MTSDPNERFDLKENKTVDELFVLFGRPIYTDPFKYPDKRAHFISLVKAALGIEEDSTP